MSLTLYRRHTKSCSKGYSQNLRIFQPNNKQTKGKDCECPISAEGTLSTEGLISNRSTRTTSWDAACEVASQWEDWGSTKAPVAEPLKVQTEVEYAVTSYLASYGPNGKNIGERTYSGLNVLLTKRLLPFCINRGLRYIKSFDDFDLVSKFIESWRNLQPTRNKRNVVIPIDGVPLADTTKRTELERLRSFTAYCVDRGWLQFNHAKKTKFTPTLAPKFGMSDDEVTRFLKAAASYHLYRRGASEERSRQLHAFCFIARWTGLRISDLTILNDRQIVPRAGNGGWAIKARQTKTKQLVYIPISQDVYELLQSLPFAGSKDGKNFWFWSTCCKVRTAKKNWYKRIITVRNEAVKASGAFTHHVTPHSFRHTFAITHLDAGVDIKRVSRWCGHQSVVITEKAYGHAVHGTLLASEDAYDDSLIRQARQNTKWLAATA